jgi:hypothetical protein
VKSGPAEAFLRCSKNSPAPQQSLFSREFWHLQKERMFVFYLAMAMLSRVSECCKTALPEWPKPRLEATVPRLGQASRRNRQGAAGLIQQSGE